MAGHRQYFWRSALVAPIKWKCPIRSPSGTKSSTTSSRGQSGVRADVPEEALVPMLGFVLFDLDNTLVDSLPLKSLRDQRRWSEVYARLHTVKLFDGVEKLWTQLKAQNIFLGIVTHSPRPYATRVLNHVGL